MLVIVFVPRYVTYVAIGIGGFVAAIEQQATGLDA